MPSSTEISIIGAGPYGLSLASYLAAAGIPFRIFGTPFNAWRTQMPRNMVLKSAGFSSSISDPHAAFSYKQFCLERNLPYADEIEPVRLEDFCAYGVEFQKRLVPQLEEASVRRLTRHPKGFKVELDHGETLIASKVVLATGTSFFEYIPAELAHLPRTMVSHSSAHRNFEPLLGKKLVVIGRGASGVNAAAFANEVGVDVELFVRGPVEFDPAPSNDPEPWHKPFLNPRSSLGPGWPSLALERIPWAFHMLPASLRLYVVKRKLGPAAGRFLREMVEDQFPVHVGFHLQSAVAENGKVVLEFLDEHGAAHTVYADHVIVGTGFRVDLARIPFLAEEIRRDIRTLNNSPVLSRHFQSTVPGLYFTGLAAAASFGPLLRFVHGSHFTSRTITRHLVKTVGKSRSASPAQSWIQNAPEPDPEPEPEPEPVLSHSRGGDRIG